MHRSITRRLRSALQTNADRCSQEETLTRWTSSAETPSGFFYRLLTVDVHQDADVGAAHSVEHLAGDGLGEEGVVGRGDKQALPGPLQQDPAFRPPGRAATAHRG